MNNLPLHSAGREERNMINLVNAIVSRKNRLGVMKKFIFWEVKYFGRSALCLEVVNFFWEGKNFNFAFLSLFYPHFSCVTVSLINDGITLKGSHIGLFAYRTRSQAKMTFFEQFFLFRRLYFNIKKLNNLHNTLYVSERGQSCLGCKLATLGWLFASGSS